jgi:NADH-quinone oxidoreductase subunit F
MERLQSVGQFEWFRNKVLAGTAEGRTVVHVCMTGCRAYGSADVKGALEDEVSRQGLGGSVEIRSTGCHGFCAKAPVIAIDPMGVQYQEVTVDDAPEIVTQTLKNKRFIDRLVYRDPKTDKRPYII